MKLNPDEILQECWERLPEARTLQDIANIRSTAWFAWAEKEMGGMEHVQFAFRNNTPIVPPDHCGHPTQLLKRGFRDGIGWQAITEQEVRRRVKLHKWPDGNHWYASLDGDDVMVGGESKWNSPEEAIQAAIKFNDDQNK